jgi:transcriptional regulator with XRE-family HTH domain
MSTQRPSPAPRHRSEAPSATSTITLARNIGRLRERRGIDLDKLALAAGMSSDALHDVERARREPTIDELWALATALHVPYSRVIHGDAEDVALPTDRWKSAKYADESPPKRRLIRRAGRGDALSELYELKLAPHSSHVAVPSTGGASENIMVTHGRARIEVDGEHHELGTGVDVTVAADVPRVYRNPEAGETTLYVLLTAKGSGAR